MGAIPQLLPQSRERRPQWESVPWASASSLLLIGQGERRGAQTENLPFGREPWSRAQNPSILDTPSTAVQADGPRVFALRFPYQEGALVLRHIVLQTSQGCVIVVYSFAFEKPEKPGSPPAPQVLEGSYHESTEVSPGFPYPYPLLTYQTPLQELGYIPEPAR